MKTFVPILDCKRARVLIAGGIVAFAASVRASLDSAQPSDCQKVTATVLSGFQAKVDLERRARAEYDELNAKRVTELQDRITLLRGTEAEFNAAREAQEKKFQDRIRWCEEAIQESTADAQRRIRAAQEEAARWRATNREDRARASLESARRIEQLLTEGKYEWFKRELGYGGDINGWRRGIKEAGEQRAKVLAEFSAGTYGIHVRALGYGATWRQVQDMIRNVQAEIAKANKRETPFHLRTLGYGQVGAQIEERLQLRLKELADAEKAIAAGTYSLFVPELGYHADRKTVERMLVDAATKPESQRRDAEARLNRALAQTPCAEGQIMAAQPRVEWPDRIDGPDGFSQLGRALRTDPGFPASGTDIEKARYVFMQMERISKKYGLRPGSGLPISNIVIGLSRLYHSMWPDAEGADSLKGWFGWGNCGEWSYAMAEIFGGAGVQCRVAYGDSDPRDGNSYGFNGTDTMVIIEERGSDGRISRRVFDAFRAAYHSTAATPTEETLRTWCDIPMTANDRWSDEQQYDSWQQMVGKDFIKDATSLRILPTQIPGSRLWPGETPRPAALANPLR